MTDFEADAHVKFVKTLFDAALSGNRPAVDSMIQEVRKYSPEQYENFCGAIVPKLLGNMARAKDGDFHLQVNTYTGVPYGDDDAIGILLYEIGKYGLPIVIDHEEFFVVWKKSGRNDRNYYLTSRPMSLASMSPAQKKTLVTRLFENGLIRELNGCLPIGEMECLPPPCQESIKVLVMLLFQHAKYYEEETPKVLENTLDEARTFLFGMPEDLELNKKFGEALGVVLEKCMHQPHGDTVNYRFETCEEDKTRVPNMLNALATTGFIVVMDGKEMYICKEQHEGTVRYVTCEPRKWQPQSPSYDSY